MSYKNLDFLVKLEALVRVGCMLSWSSPLMLSTEPGGTSLVAQWVRLCAPNAGCPGSIPGWATRSLMHAATKSLHAATKSSHAATKKPAYRNYEPACHN